MLLAALCIGITLALVLFSVLHRSATATQRRLDMLLNSGQPRAMRARDVSAELPPRGELVKQRVRQLMPTTLLDRLSGFLLAAGMPNASPELVLAIWGIAALGPPLLSFVLFAGRLPIYAPLALFLLGAYVPYVIIRGRVKSRRKKMLRALPDAMDLLTTCVEAGLGIDAAMARAGEKVKEPLGEEFRVVLRTMALGRTRREALQQLAQRTGLPELETFTNALVQAETMGVSVGQVLRVQADAIRVQRKQRAEQQAAKAPVKIIVVLALFIFPAMFIIILGPAGITIMNHGL